MNSSIASPSLEASRPHSIAELAEMAKQSLGDEARPFKIWLRIAELSRRDAKSFQEQGDLESSFIEFARAATIVLEKIPGHPDYTVLLSPTQRHNMHLHGQEILDSLAEIKLTLMIRFEQWRANPSSAQFQSAPAPVSHLAPQHLVVAPVPLPTSVGSSQSRDSPDVVNVLSTKEFLNVTAEVSNEGELETDSLIYSPGPSFISSDTTSIASYKTEKSINSRKSRYNALPRRKYADIGQPRLPPGLVSEDVGSASAPVPNSGLSDDSFSSPLGIIPIALKTNFLEESRPDLGTQPLDRPLKIHGSSIIGLSIVNTASQLEGTINRWASEVLRTSPAPAAALQEAVLTDITEVGESTALFTDVQPMTVQSLLQHALVQVISEGVINSLIVTSSAEENLGFTRVHERLLTRDAATAAVWRRHTFSAAVEFLTPEMMRMIFEKNMPLLAALLPDNTEDRLGTRGVLEDAFKFSCMLRGKSADAAALYRSFVPKLSSTLNSGLVELVKPCRRSELGGEVDRVGVTIFPGLVEVLPTPPIVQTVVRRAQVICECELLATGNPVLAPPRPLPLPPPPRPAM